MVCRPLRGGQGGREKLPTRGHLRKKIRKRYVDFVVASSLLSDAARNRTTLLAGPAPAPEQPVQPEVPGREIADRDAPLGVVAKALRQVRKYDLGVVSTFFRNRSAMRIDFA